VPGEIPAGSSVVSPQLALQSVVKNRWPDGSVKLALLAGHVDLLAGVERTITLHPGPALAGSALTEAALIASGLTATLAFAPFGSVEPTSLIGVAAAYDAGLGRWSAGRVLEWYAGPESASWLYSAPIGSDAHLTAWFEVRAWRGGAGEVLAWIENGFLRVPGATLKSGTASLVVGGSTRFAASLSLPHHTRAVLVSGSLESHWLGSEAPVRIRHDVQHLQSTGLVPAYLASATNALLSRLATSYAPLARNEFPVAMGSAGYHPSIGLLPEWEVAYLCSDADPRALVAVIAHARHQRYGTRHLGHLASPFGGLSRLPVDRPPLLFGADPVLGHDRLSQAVRYDRRVLQRRFAHRRGRQHHPRCGLVAAHAGAGCVCHSR